MLLCLDPGTNSPGIALFHMNTLIAAGRVELRPEAKKTDDYIDPGQRWVLAAHDVLAWVIDNGWDFDDVNEILYERPKIYREHKSKGDPNKLIGIAGVASAFAGMISVTRAHRRITPVAVHTVLPSEWTLGTSKVCPTCEGRARKKCRDCAGSDWETPRGRLIRSRLTVDELKLIPDQNDAIDAAGLGLFWTKRLVKHVFSNGR